MTYAGAHPAGETPPAVPTGIVGITGPGPCGRPALRSPSELVKLTGPVRLRVGLVTSCAIQQPFASISLRPFQPQFILRPDPTIECGIQIFVVHVQLSWNVTLLPDRLSMVEGSPRVQHHAWNARMWTSYLSWDPDILILSKLNSVGRGFSRTSTSYISESMTCA